MFDPETTRRGEESQQPILRKPVDETRVKQLEAKRIEYQTRLVQQGLQDPTAHPDAILSPRGVMKLAILDRVLETGEVPMWEFSAEFGAQHEGLITRLGPEGFESTWNDAAAVIESYCTTGGEGVHGGTGLPAVD